MNGQTKNIRLKDSFGEFFSWWSFFLSNGLLEPFTALFAFVRLALRSPHLFFCRDKERKRIVNKYSANALDDMEQRLRVNPVLRAFQKQSVLCDVEQELVDVFLESSRAEWNYLKGRWHSRNEFRPLSGEMVGLIGLRILTQGDGRLFEKFKKEAMSMGSAFQKVQLLSESEGNFERLGRLFFRGQNLLLINERNKEELVADIRADFREAARMLNRIPENVRFAVHLAYAYHLALFDKIIKTPAVLVKDTEFRLGFWEKWRVLMVVWSYVKWKSFWRDLFNREKRVHLKKPEKIIVPPKGRVE